MRQSNVKRPLRRLAALLLILLLAASFLPPRSAQAQGGEKVVRVGWHEEPYFITDTRAGSGPTSRTRRPGLRPWPPAGPTATT